MYTRLNPSFYYIKVGFKGVKIIQACIRDVLTKKKKKKKNTHTTK